MLSYQLCKSETTVKCNRNKSLILSHRREFVLKSVSQFCVCGEFNHIINSKWKRTDRVEYKALEGRWKQETGTQAPVCVHSSNAFRCFFRWIAHMYPTKKQDVWPNATYQSLSKISNYHTHTPAFVVLTWPVSNLIRPNGCFPSDLDVEIMWCVLASSFSHSVMTCSITKHSEEHEQDLQKTQKLC